jgi:hypothetical protein
MIDAIKKIKAAAKSKIYSNEYKEVIPQYRAADKIVSAVQSKLYSDKLQQYQVVNKTLAPMLKQARTRTKYINARDKYIDKKEENKLATLEAQAGYIENI